MASFNDRELSFGRYLQSCRKMNNVSLEAIAHELKVGTGVLMAIENEDLSRMPDEVFAKGFLRGYARIVNADEGRVIHSYLQRRQQFDRSILSHYTLARENDLFWRKLMLSLTVLCLVIFLTIFVLSRPEEQIPVAAEPTVPVQADTAGERPAPLSKLSPDKQVSGPIHLSIITVADTWLKIIIDDQKNREYTLRPGDHLEFEAARRYNLLIGNAAGVKLFANRVPVDIPEEPGKVVNIEIP